MTENDDTSEYAYQRAVREREELEQVQATVSALSKIANRSLSPELFVQCMDREHRTLQQSMSGLMLAWFKHLAELPAGHYDLRNQASVEIARKVMTATEGYIGLPLI
jgi:hypothetical protein